MENSMDKLQALITEIIEQNQLTQAILSSVRVKAEDHFQKVTLKPIELKGELAYQFSFYYPSKVLHENLQGEEAKNRLFQLFQEHFKQGNLHTTQADYQILISKKFKVTILRKNASKPSVSLEHNRKKNYLLEEGKPVPFLIELGVMNTDGKVLAKKYDKFRQINRFLEMIEDIVPYLSQDRVINIIDFGCGKSYLTFALYHYLHEIKGLQINVIGLDLKRDVIDHCNRLVEQFNYQNLKFLVGDIGQYNELDQVDMVVTLHACDTATDAALEKAVRWNASVILSVPCCQHELLNQVQSEVLEPMLKHGIIKERFSSLLTDSIRGQLLEMMGYKVQMLEFIDMEHTPKNLLIRAVKSGKQDMKHLLQQYLELKKFLQVQPYLEKALQDKLPPILKSE